MSGVQNSKARYHEPYSNLAAAILESGIRCNDTLFLESDWADTLREICALDDRIYGDRQDVRIARTRVHASSPRMELDNG